MKNLRISLKALAAATLLAAASAQAVLLDTATSLTNPLVTTFDSFDGLITAGPQLVSTFGAFTTTVQSTPEAELGASIANLGDNGLWGAGKVFAALTAPTVDDTGVMTFLFSNSISAVGAFVNHELFAGVGELTIVALGISGDVLESYVLNIFSSSGDVAVNEGSFFGIGRANRDIYGLQLSGSAFVLDDLTVSVPAPPALALLALGLGMLGVSRRR